ncbi:hydrogenase maturation protease [Saprospiraceae bacterium]|nr:hydrogenase maturation protease [Saprospiraceae bacterium]MDB4768969.1 hydrogenase maturation protease [Saprospiraceae bacterium]MDC3219733.1 hydrogenase maturation protease [Saprospiraceae bacterium]
MDKPKILIAGIGNELRQDDAFGMEFIQRWDKQIKMPDHIHTMEVGIGGIHLVQELHAAYDILIMADAVDWESEPGKIFFQEIEKVSDIEDMPLDKKREFLADMHYTNPVRALMLAKALNVLPKKVYILGCQSLRHDDFAIGMSDEVKNAIPKAIEKLKTWLQI